LIKSILAIAALLSGEIISHAGLEETAFLFMEGDELYYRRSLQSVPVPYQLDGRDLRRSDWRVVKHEEAVYKEAV
jgi:hypothetical protein